MTDTGDCDRLALAYNRPHTFNNIVNIRWIDHKMERVRVAYCCINGFPAFPKHFHDGQYWYNNNNSALNNEKAQYIVQVALRPP